MILFSLMPLRLVRRNNQDQFSRKVFLDQSQRLQKPKLCGLLNKSDTCYANSLIQTLYSLSRFCFRFLKSSTQLPHSFSKVCHQLLISKPSVDPSLFLKALKNVVVKSGNYKFNNFSQQDTPEILQHVISEFTVDSLNFSRI